MRQFIGNIGTAALTTVEQAPGGEGMAACGGKFAKNAPGQAVEVIGWNQNLRGYDAGSFKCKFERGRVVDIDFDGIRGL